MNTDLRQNLKSVEFQCSVTELVQFCCRRGNIEPFGDAGPGAQEGIRGHQKLQKKRQQEHKDYQSEVSIRYVFSLDEDKNTNFPACNMTVTGRIDGLCSGNTLFVEEIKTCYQEPELIPLSVRSVNECQLKMYAAIWVLQQDLPVIEARLSWYNLIRDHVATDLFRWNIQELREFSLQIVRRYCQWLVKVQKHRQALKSTLKKLKFPFFDFRSNQRALCAEVYRHIRSKSKLMFEAPTGVGKSLSTLFPAFKALGEGLVDQIVFLTAKTSGRKTAFDTCRLLNSGSEKAKVLVINAKADTCFCEQDSHQGICTYTLEFYEQLPAALERCFEQQFLDESLVAEIAREFQICPFSLSLFLVPWMDVVIADYNYVFDPLVQLAHFKEAKHHVMLIDEAHNLIDRSRSMYSATLNENDANEILKVQPNKTKLHRHMTKLLNEIHLLVQLSTTKFMTNHDLLSLVQVVNELCNQLIEKSKMISLSSQESSWLKQLIRFKVISDLAGRHHSIFIRSEKGALLETWKIEWLCLNAAEFLATIFSHSGAVVLFSATLTPFNYVQNSLGLNRIESQSKGHAEKRDRVSASLQETITGKQSETNVSMHQLPSAFSAGQCPVYLHKGIDGRYQYRDLYIDAIVEVIFTVHITKRGNYLACFSSYAFLQKVQQRFEQLYPKVVLLVQHREQTPVQRNEFIEQFKQQGVLGFVISGGSFTEGIDFIGDLLHGVIIVGLGLPMVNEVQEAIKQDFEEQGLNGFDMAYRYPGIQRVLQTAGRVIRSESDRGVIVLLDRRFGQSNYRSLMPRHWRINTIEHVDELALSLQEFWL